MMAVISQEPGLPTANPQTAQLTFKLTDVMRRMLRVLNQHAEGRIEGHNTYTAAPTTGSWAAGDEVKNSAPAEMGTAGNKYVIRGWICVASGTPGTWKEQRVLTGG